MKQQNAKEYLLSSYTDIMNLLINLLGDSVNSAANKYIWKGTIGWRFSV